MPVDPVEGDEDPPAEQQEPMNTAMEGNAASQESDDFVEIKATTSQDGSDVEMKGMFTSYLVIRMIFDYDFKYSDCSIRPDVRID